jgi:hypothetical protein
VAFTAGQAAFMIAYSTLSRSRPCFTTKRAAGTSRGVRSARAVP